MQLREPAVLLWLTITVLAGAASAVNAIHSAALSTIAFGAVIPIFHGLFSFTPALLAGALFHRRGGETRRAAALGTGAVTVPLFALSWALLSGQPGDWLAIVTGTLKATVLLAVVPLAAAVALVSGFRNASASRPRSAP